MNPKLLLGVAIALVAVIGWFIYQGNVTNYVATIDKQVTELEDNLVELQASIDAGTLTPAQSVEAQTKIAAKIAAINDAVTASKNEVLTEKQKAQLLDGLERLKKILTEHSEVLQFVERAVQELPPAKRPRLGGSGTQSIITAIEETVASVSDYAEEVIEDFTPADEEVMNEETSMDENASSTEGESGFNVSIEGEASTTVETGMPVPTEEGDGVEDMTTSTDTEAELINQ